MSKIKVITLFQYTTTLDEDDLLKIEVKHHCDEGCSTKDIDFEITKDDFMAEEDIGVATINKLISEKDDEIRQAIHDIHDLISVKKSMIKI